MTTKAKTKTNTLATGLAMFAMFFGAGNIVFPLELGAYAQNQNFFAILGLLITAVGVPFLGLTAMTLFDGDYKLFFDRIGKIPGFVVATFIMGLIGPFGATPRCITLSHSTLKLYFPEVSLPLFSIIACVIIFAFTFKRNRILDILGYYLTPFLMASLGIIIVKGLLAGPALPVTDHSAFSIFFKGVFEGYHTMDLMGAFFFSSVVLAGLRQNVNPGEKKDYKALIIQTIKAGCIGASLLAIAYIGFSYVAASLSQELANVPSDQLIAAISVNVLGGYAGLVVCVAVALACLTTAIALVTIFAEFIHIDIARNNIGYVTSLIITLVITFLVSTLNFTGIKMILAPILEICYPSLILLSAMNILHKLYRVKMVKTPVFILFAISLFMYVKQFVS